VITERNIISHFYFWMRSHDCEENLTFWIETQNFKYLKEREEIVREAERIFEKYFNIPICTLNIDDPNVIPDLKNAKM